MCERSVGDQIQDSHMLSVHAATQLATPPAPEK